LDGYGLKNKIIAYVIDEGSNLNIITSFRFEKNLLGKTFWAFFFPKACQYAIEDEIFCKGFKYVFIKFAQ
jgi:hypothetical protein